tara:strand:- start:187 stop:1575 length:1389 start_codon:yes stop_codon:yes gene_type:complete
MADNNISEEEKKRQKDVMDNTKFRTFNEFLDLKHQKDEEFKNSKLNKSLGEATGLDDSLERVKQQGDLTNEALKASSGYLNKLKKNSRQSAADKYFGDFVDTKTTVEQVGDKGDLARYNESLGKKKKDGLNVYEGQGSYDPDAKKLAQQNYERNVELHGEKFANRERKQAQKQAERNIKKLKKQDKRATKVARRKGMSKDQAKDFMANRRDRLNNAMKETFKGMLGLEQDLGSIKDRYWRGDKSGTIQNQRTKDGKIIDATAPFQGEGLEQINRGGVQNKVTEDYYSKFNDKADKLLPAFDFKKFTEWSPTPKTPVEQRKENTEDVVDKGQEIDLDQGADYTDKLFKVKDNVRTRYNSNFYNNRETIPGFGEGDTKDPFKNYNFDNIDRNGLQTTLDEITLNKALSGSGNVSFNDNFAGKYGNVGGMKKSNYNINPLNPSGGIKPFKPLRNAIKNYKDSKKK